ncbi:AmmeMemoRadiSam system protein A [Clostridium sp. CTA-5]
MKNILGYYLMPHPPIIIPDIGKGEEKKIESTLNSCNKIAQEISDIKPNTIVVITPHATMFSDAIAISNEEKISGDLSKFNCLNIKMNISIDRELNNKIIQLCADEEIPAVPVDSKFLLQFNRKYELDHGTMVPLYFVNKYYKEYKLVHITYSMIGDLNLYKFGMNIKKAIEELNRKVVIIASGDLSHKLKEEGPYSYSPYGEKFDKELLNNLEKGNVLEIFNMNKTMIEKAGECGLNSILVLLGATEGSNIKGNILSYEGPFGVGYGVMKFDLEDGNNNTLECIAKKKEENLRKKINDSNPYVKLARENLIYYFIHGKKIKDLSNISNELLNQKHGVFVSLKKFGNLRGCIGTILPTTNNIAEEIIKNSIEAAIHDPRFAPVSESELEDIEISVDVLMDAQPCRKEELNPKKYGVIVSNGYKRGLLLPDLEGVDTIEEQLKIACEKAGLWQNENYNIEKFEVIRYKEGE